MLLFPLLFLFRILNSTTQITAAKAARDLHIPDQFFLVCNFQVQQGCHVGSSVTRVKKLSSVHSSNFLGCLCVPLLASQMIKNSFDLFSFCQMTKICLLCFVKWIMSLARDQSFVTKEVQSCVYKRCIPVVDVSCATSCLPA